MLCVQLLKRRTAPAAGRFTARAGWGNLTNDSFESNTEGRMTCNLRFLVRSHDTGGQKLHPGVITADPHDAQNGVTQHSPRSSPGSIPAACLGFLRVLRFLPPSLKARWWVLTFARNEM